MEKSIVFRGELRAEAQGDKFQIAGYAALFNSPSKNLGGFVETVAPGAFDRALREKQVVRFTFNHSMDAVLARSDNGSLALSTDNKGLRFVAQLNQNIQQHRDIFEACKSGLYNECSFAFTVAPNGQTWSTDGTQRTLTDVDLMDVSLVGVPAYAGTSAAARSASASTSDLLARALAMPGDWARQEKAHEITLQLLDEQQRDASAAADVSDVDDEDDFDDLRKALTKQFGRGEHGLPCYFPVELKGDQLIVADVGHLNPTYYTVPVHQDDAGKYNFGLPKELLSYAPTVRAAIHDQEARQAKADAELKFRMRAAAGY